MGPYNPQNPVRPPSVRPSAVRPSAVRPSVRPPSARPSVRRPSAVRPSVRRPSVRPPSVRRPSVHRPSVRPCAVQPAYYPNGWVCVTLQTPKPRQIVRCLGMLTHANWLVGFGGSLLMGGAQAVGVV